MNENPILEQLKHEALIKKIADFFGKPIEYFLE